ncbi:MAG: S1/P1 nuclease [Tannerella sp.]|jgi:hypothetical protein|nr:S1/P1 nuclease [Tannerella sp.]
MKRKSFMLISAMFLLMISIPVFGWGGKGHYVIAGIAEKHLTRKAKKVVQKLLEGNTMAYYSTWMDDIRGDSTFAYTYTWHYANVDEGKTYETMEKIPEGDVITATQLSIDMLQNKSLTDSVRSMYLKFLIHLIGDMHCPMHAGRATDRGGNDFVLKWRTLDTNLHSVWDGLVIDDARIWNSLEWSTYIDKTMNRRQRNAIQAGEPFDWFNETVDYAKDIYEKTPKNLSNPRPYTPHYFPLIGDQFLKAGYRLAGLLNILFR